MTRELVVNADDLGRSAAINEGILRAHVEGIVTSASLMVRWPAAPEAVALASAHPLLGLGLHLDLGEWFDRDGEWLATYEVVDVTDGRAVAQEVKAQLEAFRTMVGRDPTHLDSHQHVHLREPVRTAAVAMAERLGVPLRHHGVHHCGGFYGRADMWQPMQEAITAEHLVELVLALPEGLSELTCHPATEACDDPLYGPERALELRALTDPRVRTALQDGGIVLRTFDGALSRS